MDPAKWKAKPHIRDMEIYRAYYGRRLNMNETMVQLKQNLRTLNLTEAAQIVDDCLMEAEKHQWTCREFLDRLLRHEIVRSRRKTTRKKVQMGVIP